MRSHHQKLHDAIGKTWTEEGRSPSHKELCAITGYQHGTVRNALSIMVSLQEIVRVGQGSYMTPEHHSVAVDAIMTNNA